MKKIIIILALLISLSLSCKKLIEIRTPQNQLTTDKVFADSSSAISAMVNVYTLFDNDIDPNYNKFMSLYTDDMDAPQASGDGEEFLTSKLSARNGIISNFWSYNYNVIYSCNLIIEQLKTATNLSAALKLSLSGEAKFLRAYSYFYLVNDFGPVPLILTTDVDQTSKAARTDTGAVYTQITSDLQDAFNELPATYIGQGKVRANKWAATALLARVQLYRRNWIAAETQANAIISSGVYSLDPLSIVFLANSDETILSFWTQNGFTSDALNLIPQGGVPPYILTSDLVNSFETGDQRKVEWIQTANDTSGSTVTTFFYPYKYHNTDVNSTAPEYQVALRVAEQYLIRAEARAQQNDVPGCISDLNMIRSRAGLPQLPLSLNQQACLAAADREWRSEFFGEWGHRFLELKRSGQLDQVMSAYKPGWSTNDDLLPIPQSDLAADPFLTQNAGY